MPFLGIVDDKKLPHVPGTVILEEQAARSHDVTGDLKHGTGRNAQVVLIPQPSDDPNDPLNWSMSKKLRVMAITCWGTILYASVCSAMLNPAFYAISLELQVGLPLLVRATGYQTLVIGVMGPLCSALARKYGKRPLFVIASVIMLVANIVGSALNTYNGILVSRILQGFAIAPYESIIFTLISDMFFLHERGVYAAWINFLLACVSNLTGVVSGPIANSLSWRWLYYLLVLLGGIHAILQYLFAPETSYNRDHRFDIDELAEDNLTKLAELERRHNALSEKKSAVLSHDELSRTGTRSSSVSHPRSPRTFKQELAIFNGTFSNENLLQLFIAPFALLSNLVIAWIVIVTAILVTFYVVIAIVLAQVFAPPPYLLSPTAIGLLSLGPFIGGLIGSILLGAISDPWIKWCARKNNGIYEPEYRLVPSLLGLTAGAGLIGWGAMTSQGISPVACATVHGIMLFGVVAICAATSAYAIDAYRAMTAEIFICSMAGKNLLIFAFTYFINNWTAHVGVYYAFSVWGGLSLGLTATVPAIFFLGKKYRSWWARNDLLKRMGLMSHEE